MSTNSNSSRVSLRAFVVVALSLFFIFTTGSDIRRLWLPVGEFGYGTNLDGVVTGINANSPAANAGMRLGDRVDVHLTPRRFRMNVIQTTWVSEPGMSVAFDLVRQGTHRAVKLTSVPEQMTNLKKVLIVIDIAVSLLIVVFGAVLVLLRPNPVTWGFFFFCFSTLPASLLVVLSLPYPIPYFFFDFYLLIASAGGELSKRIFKSDAACQNSERSAS